ncbi:alpha/beta hydrolase [Coraliomargarita sp. W4R53]
MAFIQCDFASETLGMGVSVNVLLPQTTERSLHPVLWLLHGRSDDHTAWMRQSSIERYAEERGLAVVMPAAGLSYYQNIHNGLRYADYIDHELPQVMRSFFPLSQARADNFIAGLSMGGYGAMRSALLYPERYAAAASLSGALDAAAFAGAKEAERIEWMRQVFGEKFHQLRGTQNDLLAQLQRAKDAAVDLPCLFACCGGDDFILEHSRAFEQQCRQSEIPLKYIENEGDHNWAYWDRMIREVLNWLPID